MTFEGLSNLRIGIINLTIPHHRNNHRPFLIRHQGLFAILVVFIITQFVANLSSGSPQVLGYATNISKSEIIKLTNNERNGAGLGALRENSTLNKAASLKAENMFKKDYWAHFAPDGTSPWYFFKLAGYQYSWAGENLARDFSTSGGVVAAWMASSGHKANIMNSNFTEIGVAVANGNLLGEDTTLVVQLFGKPIYGGGSQATGNNSKPVKLNNNVVVPGEGESLSGDKIDLGAESLAASDANILSLIKNTSTSQRVTLALLLFVFALLVTDSFIIYKARHFRLGSHSLIHASVILLLIVSVLLYGKGIIL